MARVNPKSLYLSFITAVLSLVLSHSGFAQGTAFFYQGQLNNNGAAANGTYNFQFQVFNAVTNGSAVSGSLTNFNVAVNNGLFTVTLDFGQGIFTGNNLWLGISVCTNTTTTFTPLWPRQPVLPVPYAIFAASASNLVGTLPASAFSGGYTNSVALTNGANLFTGSFSGNGGSVTNVNVTNLTGVLADSQLPVNTAFLNSNQTFTASNTFNGVNIFTNLYGNSFAGSFFGNGLVGWVVVPGTSVQASIDHGYLLTNSQIVTVTLPATANVGDIVRIASTGANGWQLAQNAGQSVLGSFYSYGKTWYLTAASTLNWTAVTASSDGTRLAATYGGSGGDGIFLSTSSGQTWVSSGASTANPYSAIASSADGTRLVATTAGNGIFTSTNSGSTWVNNSIPANENWTGVASSSSGANLVAVANSAGIYTNSGTSWGYAFGNGGTWTCVAYAGGSEFIACASGAGIYVSMNNGDTWSQLLSSGSSFQSIAASANGSQLIVAVPNGGIYISTNAGTSWPLAMGLPASANWSSVASSADGSKLVAAVNGGNIYTSSNWGATWQTNTIVAKWAGVATSSGGTTLAAVINNTGTTTPYGIYTAPSSAQVTTTTVGTAGYITGSQCSSVELQCIATNQFMPASFSGQIWAY
jgi:hypothetical protein